VEHIAQSVDCLFVSDRRPPIQADQVAVLEKLGDFQLLNTIVAQPAEVGDQILQLRPFHPVSLESRAVND